MKKYNIYKVLGIVIALTILISYFVPQTTISYGAVSTGELNPVSILSTFSNVITSFNVFISVFIYILVLGVFYGILKKTGKYEILVNNMAAKFSSNKGLFIIVCVLFLGILTAIFGDLLPMLIFVPLLIDVTLKLGYKKTTAVAVTIGSILLGNAGSLHTTVTNQILSTTVSSNILYKIIIALVGLLSLIVFVLIFNKPEDKVKLETKKGGNLIPIIITLCFILVFLILGMTSWSDYFGFKGFEDLFKTITDFKVFKISAFNAFIGSTVAAFGAWQIFDILVLVSLASLLLCIIYRIDFNSILEVGASSIKKVIPYAFIVVIANVVLVNTYSSGWFVTTVKVLAGSKFNLFSGIISSFISAIVYPDYSYGLQFTLTTFVYSITKTKDFYPLLAVVYQAIYSTTLLIAPTSVFVLLGLHHLNIRFIDWVKYIWKYFVIVLVMDIIVLGIVSDGFNIPVIVALLILVAIVVLLVYRKINDIKQEIVKVNEPVKKLKIEPKKETKEVKKTTTKSKTTKKTTKSKTNKK